MYHQKFGRLCRGEVFQNRLTGELIAIVSWHPSTQQARVAKVRVAPIGGHKYVDKQVTPRFLAKSSLEHHYARAGVVEIPDDILKIKVK